MVLEPLLHLDLVALLSSIHVVHTPRSINVTACGGMGVYLVDR